MLGASGSYGRQAGKPSGQQVSRSSDEQLVVLEIFSTPDMSLDF